MKKLTFLFIIIVNISCAQKKLADLIVTNAKVYTVNNTFEIAEAFAIKDGKFLETGSVEAINNKYGSSDILDAKGQTILPGLIDAHCHFYRMGMQQLTVDLVGTKSFQEVVQRIIAFQNKYKSPFILGRGWDQNDWKIKEFPNKDILDQWFPKTPIAITRIDEHAMLCNQAALDLAGITKNTKVEGGEIVKVNGELTGVLIDNPIGLVRAIIPTPTKKQEIEGLLAAQKICFDLGLTTVDDAGLDKSQITLIDSLQKAGVLKMRVYAMVSSTSPDLEEYLVNGIIKTEKLNVRSVKVYGDGALGSRGATLKAPYSDKDSHHGAMLTSPKAIEALADRIVKSDYQMNTHAIGDSANVHVLRTYKSVLKEAKDRRWRIEHAQVLTNNDLLSFKDANIMPSVQPTHATSDMYWAGERLGADRLKGAYAYKELLQVHGKIALGTDFPVEHVNPMLTFYAAVARQDLEKYPEGGFQMENALTREETLKGMTIWAAYSNFEEPEKGSIEAGKFADFIILDKNIMEIPVHEIPKVKVKGTYVDGVAQ